jgi:hypothetical protein
MQRKPKNDDACIYEYILLIDFRNIKERAWGNYANQTILENKNLYSFEICSTSLFVTSFVQGNVTFIDFIHLAQRFSDFFGLRRTVKQKISGALRVQNEKVLIYFKL